MITKSDLLECVAHSRANDCIENKAALRAEIARQTEAFLAAGGGIEQAVSVPLRAERMEGSHTGSTDRRWVGRPPPRSATEAQITRKRYQRHGGQNIVLPGSSPSPKPKGRRA